MGDQTGSFPELNRRSFSDDSNIVGAKFDDIGIVIQFLLKMPLSAAALKNFSLRQYYRRQKKTTILISSLKNGQGQGQVLVGLDLTFFSILYTTNRHHFFIVTIREYAGQCREPIIPRRGVRRGKIVAGRRGNNSGFCIVIKHEKK